MIGPIAATTPTLKFRLNKSSQRPTPAGLACLPRATIARPTSLGTRSRARANRFYYFAYGAAVSEVAVDGFTGTFQLRQVDIVHDVGESLNPLVDRGQIEGAFVQGMGWLTMEELVWDEAGRLRTFAPSTYKIPTVSEIPENFEVHLLTRAAQEGVIYGSKAVGEPPFMLAMSVREAIREAIAAFGPPGTLVPLQSPATPEAILTAIEAVQAQSRCYETV